MRNLKPYIIILILVGLTNFLFAQSITSPPNGSSYLHTVVNVPLTATPASGTFTGLGVTDLGGAGGNGIFNPSVAGVGAHEIHYVKTSGGTWDVFITVHVIPTVAFAPSETTFCETGNNFAIDGYSGTPAGGVFSFSGNGVVSGTFYPELAGVGTHAITVTYTLNGESNSTSVNFVVQASPAIGIQDLEPKQCQDDPDYTIWARDTITLVPITGGTYTGKGITDNGDGTALFSPFNAGLGYHNITFNYTDVNSCVSTVTKTARVGTEIFIEGLASTFCLDDPIDNFIYYPHNAAFDPLNRVTGPGVVDNLDGTASFDPALAGVGVHTITYTFVDPIDAFITCTNIVTQTVQVYAMPAANFFGLNDDQQYCYGAADVSLIGNYAPAGTFSGDGILDHGNGTATFQPSTLGVGTYSISYSYTNASGCIDVETKTVEILPLPTLYMVTGGGTYCDGAGGVAIGLSNSTTGVNYTLYRNGIAVVPDNTQPGSTGNPINFGNQTIAGTYTVIATNATTGCTQQMAGSASVLVTSQALLTTQPVDATVCEDGSATFTVEATGENLSYQWTKNAINVGSDNNVLVLNALTLADNNNNIICTISSTCGGPLTSNTVKLYVNPKTQITTHPSSTVACSGTGITLSVVASGINNSYRWEKGGVAVANVAGKISGATTANLTILNLNPVTDAGTYVCYVDGDCGIEVSSNPAILSIDDPIVITTQPTSVTACLGSNTSFSVVATGTSLLYQWQKNGVDIAGATNSSLALNSIVAGDAASYRCVITSPCGASTPSTAATLTIPTSTTVTNPTGGTVCELGNINLSVVATGAALQYKWYRGGVLVGDDAVVSNSSTANLSLTGITQAYEENYTVQVTGTCGIATSAPAAAVVVMEPIVFITQPSSQTVCTNSDAAFSVSVSGDVLSYQWQRDVGAGFVNILGATSDTYTELAVNSADAGRYSCVISTSSCGTYTSAEATLTVNPLTVISSNPSNKSACVGSTVTFSVVATGVGLTYQWYKNAVSMGAGYTNSTLTLNNITTADAASYYCVVTGTCGPAATSTSAILTVDVAPVISVHPQSAQVCAGSNHELTVTLSAGTNPTYQWYFDNGAVTALGTAQIETVTAFDASEVGNYYVTVANGCGTITSNIASLSLVNPFTITTQPTDKSVCENGTVTFSVVASQPGLSYQWKKNGVDIAGATLSSLVLNNVPLADDSSNYSCQINNSCTSTLSNVVTLTVDSVIAINQQPTSGIACDGEPFSISIFASSNHPLSYQWYKAGFGPIPLATNSTYSFAVFNAATDIGTYYCTVSNSCGTITSTNAIITAGEDINITDEPDPLNYCAGLDANFTITVTGTNPVYSWRKNNTPLVDDGRIVGATTNSLVINDITSADEGTYDCIVTGSCGSETSIGAYLDVLVQPSIAFAPVPQTICSGATASFGVTAAGELPLSYQWQKNGVDIDPLANATADDPTFEIVGAVDTDAGIYRCIITNSCGTVTSTSAELIVEENVDITVHPASTTVCQAATANFGITVTGPTDMALQWYKDGVALSESARIVGVNLSTLSINDVTSADAGSYWCEITSSCGNTVSSTAILTVHNQIFITQQPQPATICPGAIMNLSIITTGTVATYQWKHDGLNVGVNSPTYSVAAFAVGTDDGDYTCDLTNVCGTITTDVATIAAGVNTVATISGDVTECEGQSANISVAVTGSNLTYKWYRGSTLLSDDVRIGGSITNSLTINNLVAADAGTYQCEVSGTCGVDNDNTAVLTVNESVNITVQPVSFSVLQGSNATLTVVASGNITGYQWQKDGVDIDPLLNPTADDATLIITGADAAVDAGAYRCIISGICGDVLSNTANITVLGALIITTQPLTPVSKCEGETLTLFIEPGTGHTYQWKVGGAVLVDDSRISGATSAALTISNLTSADTGPYTCTVDGVEISTPSIVTVSPKVVFTVNPVDAEKCVGDIQIFSVTATGAVSYQWYNDLGPIGVATSNEYTINSLATADAGNYYCEVTGACDIKQSSVAKLTIHTPASINAQPESTPTICQGISTTLLFDVSGDVTYLWKKNGGTITDANISGTTSNQLVIDFADPSNSGDYSCTVTDYCGNQLTSNVATLTVNPITVITTQPISRTKCENDGVVFTVAAEGNGLTYDWQRNGVSIGVATSTLSISPLVKATHEGTYTCIVSGDCGIPVTSDPAVLTINRATTVSAPTFTVNPICENGSTTISVTTTGDGLTYLWKKDNLPITGTNISGITSSTLIISNALTTDAGVYTCTVTGACGTQTSSNGVLIVNPATFITTQPVNATRCAGDGVQFNVVATGQALTYEWRYGGATGTPLVNGVQPSGAVVSGQGTSQLKITGLTASEAGSYACVITGTCGNENSLSAILTMNTPVQITVQPPATTICQGTSTEITFTYTGNATSFKWKKNGSYITDGGNLLGTGTDKLQISNAALTDAGFYSCEVTGTCNGVNTQSAQLVVNPIVQITQNPVGATLCEGNNVQFTVAATGVAPLTYDWRLNNVSLGAPNSSSLTINGIDAADAGAYTCVVTGASCGTATSSPATLVVNPQIDINNQPNNLTVCEDNTAIFTVDATGTGTLDYKWLFNNSYLADDGRIVGTTTNQLKVNLSTNSDEGIYKCEISSTCGNTTSNSVTLAVTDSTKITAHPVSQTLVETSTVTFNVVATGAGLTYQWERNLGAGYNPIAGATSSSYTIPNVNIGDAGQYRCVVTGSCGVLTSNIAILTVNQLVVITSQPTAITRCVGQSASFTVVASGTIVSYQWKFNGANISDGSGISGATSENLVIASVTSANAGQYSCSVTGSNNIANSNTALLTVNQIAAITTQPLSQTKCDGDMLVLEVLPNDPTLTYTWQFNGGAMPVDPRITGANASMLVITDVSNADAGSYRCVVSNSCASETSDPAVIAINPVVQITSGPTSVIQCVGQSAYFSIVANLATASYQWYKNGSALSNVGNVSGATAANLVISNLSTADAGNYSCRVYDNCTYDNSVVVGLTVNSTTIVQNQPENTTVCEGSVAFFEVDASPAGLSYQWQKDGANLFDIAGKIEGATTSVLVIRNTDKTSDEGVYRCVITGGCNDEITNPASLTVNKYPDAAGVISGLQTVCQGDDNVLYVVPAISNATTYVWDVSYGATVVGGLGTRTIQVDYSNSSLSGAVTVYGKNSCGDGVASAPLAVTVNPLPTAYAGIDQNICSATTQLEGNNVAGGEWSIYSGDAVIVNSSQYNTTVNNLLIGENLLVWKVTQLGCSVSDTVKITNQRSVVNAGTDQVICSRNAQFNAVVPSIGASWIVINGYGTIETPSSPTSNVTGLNQGSNTFAWQVNNAGCISADSVIITNNAPFNPEAGPDQIVAFDATDLNADVPEAGTTGFWQLISGGGVFDDPTDPKTRVSSLMPGPNVLVWTVQRVGCTLSDTIVVDNILVEDAEAGTNQTLCVNYTTLNAKRPDIGVGEWSVIRGQATFDDKYKPNAKVTNLGQDTVVLRWTVRTSILGVTWDEVTIINNMPTQANAGPDMTLCTNQVNLAANLPTYGIGTWTLNSGAGNIADTTLNNSLITNLGPDKNELKWTIDYHGCISEDFVAITNNTPTTAYAGEDQVICFDSTVLLPNTPTYGVGSWSVQSGRGIFDGNTVTQLASGTNTFIYTISKGTCRSSDDVNVINNKPTTPNAGYDQSICVDNIQLSANFDAIGDGTWTVINGSGTFSSYTSNTPSVTGLAFGDNIFRWTITNNGCTEFDEVIISNNFILATAGSDETLCQDSLQLKASNPLPGVGTWTILAASSATFDNQNAPNTWVKNLSKGVNSFRWTVSNKGCVSYDDIAITNNEPTQALAGENQSVCSKSATLYANEPTWGTGVWSAMSGAATFADPNNYQTTVSNLAGGPNVLRWTITQGTCVSYDEVIITSNLPVNVFAGNDQVACSDTAVLSANPPSLGSGQWSIISGAGSFANRYLYNTAVRNLGQGDNVFRWTVSSSDCHVSDTVVIRSSIPTTSIAGASQILCADSTVLGGNTPSNGTGSWSIVSGSVQFENINTPNTKVRNISRGVNILAWVIDKDGCQSSSQMTITNNQPSTPFAGYDRDLCGDSIRLFADPPSIGTGYWTLVSGDANILDPSNNETRVVNIEFGTNTFRWTVTNKNCVMSDDVVITSNYAYANAGADFEVNTPSAQLIGNKPAVGTGTWSLSAGQGTIENPTNFETMVNGLGSGSNVFQWSINYNGCVASDLVTVNYVVWPTADFEPSTYVGCSPLEVNFVNTSIGGAPYSWDFGDGGTSNQPNVIHTFQNPGVYTVRLTATAPLGNTVIAQKQITVYGHPVASFDIAPREVYIPGQHISCYNYSTHADTSYWNFGDGREIVVRYAPTYTYQDTGVFDITLTIVNGYGCTDSVTVVDAVHVIMRSGFFFPEAFTPNPSGGNGGDYSQQPYTRSNDVFYPIVINGEITDYELKIFNRMGVLIFKTDDILVGWDGYYQDKLQPQDVYVYKVTGRYNSGEKFEKTGNVLLLRIDN